METFAIYLMKSAIWISGFTLVYYFFLKSERFFKLKRIYLISGIVISFILPAFAFHYKVIVPVLEKSDPASLIDIYTPVIQQDTIDFRYIPVLIYLAGMIFLAVRLIRNMTGLYRTIKKYAIDKNGPAKVITTSEFSCSFSYLNYIFINPSVNPAELKEIVNHELVHVRQKHWFDLVLIELLRLFQWANPFAWIYTGFVRLNHEYLADQEALQLSSDPAMYKAALLNQIFRSPVISMSNSFNYSINKKRFEMMKNVTDSPFRKMKLLTILPVIALLIYAFATPEYSNFAGRDLMNSSAATIMQGKIVKGTVLTQNGQPLPGTNIVIVGGTLGTSTDEDGKFKLEGLPEDAALAVTFLGYKSKVVKPDFNSEMTITLVKDTIQIKAEGSLPEAPPPPPPPPPLPKDNKKAPALHDQSSENIFVVVEEMPEFPGGRDAMFSWISRNLHYPPDAISKKIEGEVQVRFVVDPNGKVGNINILKSDNKILNDEAVRLVSAMPKWKPGSQNGRKVDVYYAVPINFKLP